MQSPTVFLIFWLPSGFHYDPSGTSAADTQYENLMGQFITDISGSTYLAIASQYPGTCNPPNISTVQDCFGSVAVGRTFIDTHPYTHQGGGGGITIVSDGDIQQEVENIVQANNIVTTGLNMLFFVFLGGNLVDCSSTGVCQQGSSSTLQCGYHSYFNGVDSQGNLVPVPYAVLPNVISTQLCALPGVAGGQNIPSVDNETVMVGHELLETLTDPLVDSWQYPTGVLSPWGAEGKEIGDLCATYGPPNLGNVSLNGHNYIVQSIWSNDDDACVYTFAPEYGTKLEFIAVTGTNSLRSDVSLSASSQSPDSAAPPFNLHPPGQTAWGAGSTHIRVFPWKVVPEPVLRSTVVSLTSQNPPPDQWLVNSFDLKVRNPNGTVLCDQSGSGTPLANVTDGSNFTFLTPNCYFFDPHPLGLDVFWKSQDLSLWHEWFHPTRAWVGPESLQAGQLGSDPYPVGIWNVVEDVFWKGTDGDTWHKWCTSPPLGGPCTWDGPDNLHVSQIGSDPHPVAVQYGGVDVFWRATDNTLWHKLVSPKWGAGLHAPDFLSDSLASDPHPIASIGSVEDIFWKGMDGDLWHMRYTPPSVPLGQGTWKGPESLHVGQLGSEPYPVASGDCLQVVFCNNVLDVFWKGTDGDLWYMKYTPGPLANQGSWSGPEPLYAGQLGSDPHPIVAGDGVVWVFWKGTDADLWYMGFTPTGGYWFGPQSLHVGQLGSDPHPVASDFTTSGSHGIKGGLEVFWRGVDNNIWHKWYEGGSGWFGPQILAILTTCGACDCPTCRRDPRSDACCSICC